MVRLLITAVLLASALSLPFERVVGMLEAPLASHGGGIGKVRRTCPSGSTAPAEIICGGAEEDGEDTDFVDESSAVTVGTLARPASREGRSAGGDARGVPARVARDANAARAPPARV